ANQPSGLVRLSKRAGLYQVFLPLRFCRYADLSLLSLTMSLRRVTSTEYTSSLSDTALSPMCKYPLSAPSVIACVVSPVAAVSLITNGVLVCTVAFPATNRILALRGLHGIKGLPLWFKTVTDTLEFRPPFGVSAASELLREVVEPTAPSLPSRLFNAGRLIVLLPVSLRQRATELRTCVLPKAEDRFS